MGIEIHLIAGVICGIIASLIASHKGRSVVGWFFAGFFIGLIGIIIVACMSNRKEEQARLAHSERERRRLREQVRQERHKSEVFRQHAMGRLDSHDHTLGVDTKSQVALPGSNPETEAALRQLVGNDYAPAGFPSADNTMWYYEIAGQTNGPVPALEIKHLLGAKKINLNTLLWAEGFTDWTPVSQIGAFQSMGNS